MEPPPAASRGGLDKLARPQLPPRLRFGLPLLVAADLALLAAAHLLTGAVTEVTGQAPLGLLTPHVASKDNLISAAGRLWQAHAWFCFFVVVGLSGLWPYLKLLATLFVAARVDLGHCSLDSARWSLQVLEVLGKYSFADVFLTCANVVIFDVTTNGAYKILALFKLEINIWMELGFACAALIVAVTLSVFLTHWALYELQGLELEQQTSGGVAGPAAVEAGDGGAREATPPDEEEAQAPGSSLDSTDPRDWSSQRIFALSAALLGALLLLIGAFCPFVTVARGGFLGNLIRPEEDRFLSLSILCICWRMLSSTGSNIWSNILVFYFFVLTLVAPMLEFLLLAFDALPWRRKKEGGGGFSRLRAGAEWAHSFGCVDVLLIVAVAIVFELHTVVEFNIGEECAPFQSIMNDKTLLSLAGLGFAASSDCFDPEPAFAPGSAVLLAVVAARFAAWRGNDAVRVSQKLD